MAGYLRAVDWFAREEPGGVGVGRVVVERGRGEAMTVPNWVKVEGVRGVGWRVRVGEAIERAIWLGDEGVEDGMFGGVYR